MKLSSRFAIALSTLCIVGLTVSARASDLLDSVQLVASSPVAAAAVPAIQTITISQTGSYVVELTDLQLPTALASLQLAIVTPTGAVASLSAAGTKTVTLAAGTYSAQLLATAASGAIGGTFTAQVTPATGGAAVWQYDGAVGPVNAAPTAGQSAMSAQFTAASAGTYQLTATDLAFPATLQSLSVGVFVHCGTTPGCTPTRIYTSTTGTAPPFSAALSLQAGTYDLFVVADASSTTLEGLYSIQISGGGTTLYGTVNPVGELPAAISVPITTGGALSLKLVDLGTPLPLGSLKAIVAQSGTVLTQAAAAGTYAFSAGAGTAQLYVAGVPGSSGQGSYEAYITEGGTEIADIAQPVLSGSAYGYAFVTTPAAAGGYQLSINDFKTPTALSSFSAVVAQQGSALTTTQGTSASFTATEAPLNILVFPTLASSTANGLFGITISATGSGVTAFQTTQGVGALFSSQTVQVSTAGAYELTLTDFAFPTAFANLAVVVTSGTSVTTTIFSAGESTLTLSPGTYILNVLAQVGPSATYGLYGLALGAAPPAPAVTLTAAANTLASGQSSTLTWTSTNATSCAASGGWNGTLGTSGSQSTGALTQTTSFTLTCTGAGGSTAASAQIAVTAASSGSSNGGGGAIGSGALLVLAALAGIAARRRRYSEDPELP